MKRVPLARGAQLTGVALGTLQRKHRVGGSCASAPQESIAAGGDGDAEGIDGDSSPWRRRTGRRDVPRPLDRRRRKGPQSGSHRDHGRQDPLPTTTTLIACRHRVGTRSCTIVDLRDASTARLRTKTSNRRRESYSTSTAAESTIIVAYSLRHAVGVIEQRDVGHRGKADQRTEGRRGAEAEQHDGDELDQPAKKRVGARGTA